jgi:type II secretory pathway pseudopilin PulG
MDASRFFICPMPLQRGFSVLTVLLLAVTIAAALAFLLIGLGPNVAGMMSSQKTTQLVAQAQFIAHRIAKCATDYPSGNNGLATHSAYPLDGNPGAISVSLLVCPGNLQNLWSGTDGVYFPVPITDFAGWTYSNSSPVTISISSNQPGAFTTAIADAASRLGVVATAGASTLTVKVIE